MQKSLSRYWLIIGTAALAIAGLFSLVLVVGRSSPLLAELFHQSLVVHVDLSVLVWFLAIACLMWSRHAEHSKPMIPYNEEAALLCFALGTVACALSPLDPKAEALMSNYIPVLHSPIFFLGLALVMCGLLLMVFRLFTTQPMQNTPVQFAMYSSGFIAAVALAAFVWSYLRMPPEITGTQYYDTVFWGGGHVLQFLHVQIVMVCWLMLARKIHSPLEGESQSASVAPRDAVGGHFTSPPPTQPSPSRGEGFLYALFSIGILCSLCVPFIYIYPIESFEHRQFFTYLMIAGNGIAPTILALWIVPGLITFRNARHGEKRALWSAATMSILLFIYGGVLGALITGQNVVIPAHYHGSIVGVTLAFMGVAYLLLPEFGYRNVSGWRLAYWQPIVYGVGQIMHISGLAWSGGYGVLRKTPGGLEALAPSVKAAMGFMGLGGLLAIIGGFMFVVVVAKSVFSAQAD